MTKADIVRFDPNATLERWPDFPPEEVAEGTPVQRGRMWIDDKARGLTAGIWDCTAMTSPWMDYPVNEFMIVLEGEVTIIEEGRETTIKAGESFILPKGLRCIWKQQGYMKKFFVIFDDVATRAKGKGLRVIKPDPKEALAPSTPPGADLLISGKPSQHAHEYFEDASGQWTVGIWDTTAYHRKLIDFSRHELMHLIEGAVTMTDDQGRAQTFKAGDTFFVPLGNRNSWKCDGYLKKIYCIFQPKVAAAIKAAE
jgi:uncharacterized cupin superfamily protein